MSSILKNEVTPDVESAEHGTSAGGANNGRQTWTDQFRALKTHKRVVLAAFGCSTTTILIGYDLTLIGSIIANDEFVKFFGVYDDAVDEWTLPAGRQLIWSVVQYIAAMVGACAAGLLNDAIGRRLCFLMTIGWTVAGTFSELFSPGWKTWIIAKFFFGTAMGFMQGNVQTYVSELATVDTRGFTLSLFQFWIITGQLVASCVLEGTSHVDGPWSWKAAVVSQFGIALFSLIFFVPFVPESPYYLVTKGRLDDARAALLKIRGCEANFDVSSALATIQETLAHERQEKEGSTSSYLECFRGTDLRRTLIAVLPMAMQLFMGFPLCGNYLAYFLKLSGVEDAFLITVIAVVCSIVAATAAFFLIERVGRRPQLLAGSFGMLPCLLAIGLIGCFGSGTAAAGRALAVLCIIWNMLYFLSVGAVGWTIVGEISSSRLRAKTTSIAAISNSLCNMAWSIAIPYLVNAEEANLGPKAGFIFFGCGVALAATAFLTIPETRNKSFQELDQLFETRTPARKF